MSPSPEHATSLEDDSTLRAEARPVNGGTASMERRFMAAADSVEIRARDLAHVLKRLEDWQRGLHDRLLEATLKHDGLRASSGLAQQVQAFERELLEVLQAWPHHRAGLVAAQQLADVFDGKVLWLVFGKFNAGKSSLCNFLAERFALEARTVRHFHVTEGGLVDTGSSFCEGVTETTARLQGVQLGQNLVLLDTPGLHSMTPENAELTRRFTDAADGVLWLTSSSSPGQVQELEELARELRRGKPLQPVLTRSDVYEEDEADGEIVKQLRNKTADNRALQEADVARRAREKLLALEVDPGQLHTPVSVSVHAARSVGAGAGALDDAGFERLYEALLARLEPALLHKQLKPAAMLLHHLEEHVLDDIHQRLSPRVRALRRAVERAAYELEQQAEDFVSRVWRRIIPQLSEVLDSHVAGRDVLAVYRDASRLLEDTVAFQLEEAFSDLAESLPPPVGPLSVEEGAGYEAVAGVVDDSALRRALEQALRQRLLEAAEVMTVRGREALGQLDQLAVEWQALLADSERQLRDIRRELSASLPAV